jgi:hypothetical protein
MIQIDLQTIKKRLYGSHSTLGRRNLDSHDIDHTTLHGLSSRQSVHRRLSKIESLLRNVDQQHVNGSRLPVLPGVGEAPARATIGRVPAFDEERATDVGEVWKGTESREPGEESVCAIGTGDCAERAIWVVVGNGVGSKSVDAGESRENTLNEGRQNNGEFHDELEWYKGLWMGEK